ncbi:uncharacterized protein RSE6_02489 [Rhynchosporium secalis]|uniref:Uncharacterized protein n=1 Tax=Rhynchosporium secalis TaxID=38038 RepID=A0A1E1M0D3_RHYSE|nr:uncharacterized protein RSE6_02489 [Rhynchosporium secalis]
MQLLTTLCILLALSDLVSTMPTVQHVETRPRNDPLFVATYSCLKKGYSLVRPFAWDAPVNRQETANVTRFTSVPKLLGYRRRTSPWQDIPDPFVSGVLSGA